MAFNYISFMCRKIPDWGVCLKAFLFLLPPAFFFSPGKEFIGLLSLPLFFIVKNSPFKVYWVIFLPPKHLSFSHAVSSFTPLLSFLSSSSLIIDWLLLFSPQTLFLLFSQLFIYIFQFAFSVWIRISCYEFTLCSRSVYFSFSFPNIYTNYIFVSFLQFLSLVLLSIWCCCWRTVLKIYKAQFESKLGQSTHIQSCF